MKLISLLQKTQSIFIFCLGCFIIMSTNVQSQTTYSLELQFSGLENSHGSTVFIAVYNNKTTFLSDDLYQGFTVNTAGRTNFNHSINLPEGQYALSFFQDLNSDMKLNKNFIGYPSEPFGFSNNAPANFGPPKWNDALFHLDKDRNMAVEF